MNVSFIVTLVGADRPGLVSALAERAAANGATSAKPVTIG